MGNIKRGLASAALVLGMVGGLGAVAAPPASSAVKYIGTKTVIVTFAGSLRSCLDSMEYAERTWATKYPNRLITSVNCKWVYASTWGRYGYQGYFVWHYR